MFALRDALRELPDAVFADLLESEEAYLLVVDMPGVTGDTIDLSVDGNRLRVEARREKDLPVEFRYLREDRALFLDAALPLPPDATGAGAEAGVERGVLELRLPKETDDPGTSVPIRDETVAGGDGDGFGDDGDAGRDDDDAVADHEGD